MTHETMNFAGTKIVATISPKVGTVEMLRKFYESGMPVDGSQSWTTTQWGRIPTQTTVTYAFATTKGSRSLQDVGYNGLTNEQEQQFQTYQDFLTQIQGRLTKLYLILYGLTRQTTTTIISVAGISTRYRHLSFSDIRE